MKFAVFSEEAKQDIAEIAQYVAAESGSRRIARDYIRSLRARCDKIANLDGKLGRPREEFLQGLRSVAHKDHVIFFRYVGDDMEIVTIIHGMRDIEAIFSED